MARTTADILSEFTVLKLVKAYDEFEIADFGSVYNVVMGLPELKRLKPTGMLSSIPYKDKEFMNYVTPFFNYIKLKVEDRGDEHLESLKLGRVLKKVYEGYKNTLTQEGVVIAEDVFMACLTCFFINEPAKYRLPQGSTQALLRVFFVLGSLFTILVAGETKNLKQFKEWLLMSDEDFILDLKVKLGCANIVSGVLLGGWEGLI